MRLHFDSAEPQTAYSILSYLLRRRPIFGAGADCAVFRDTLKRCTFFPQLLSWQQDQRAHHTGQQRNHLCV